MSQHKFLIFISMLYISLMIISGEFVHRIISFGNLVEPGGILIFPLTYFLGDAIAEIYGYDIAKNVLYSSLVVQILFFLIVDLLLKIKPSLIFHDQLSFETVFKGSLTYSSWFTIGTIIGGTVNIKIITYLKLLLKGKYFWLRSFGSTIIGEFVFSIIALTPSLASSVSLKKALIISLSAYLFKIIYGLFLVIPSSLLVLFLKRYENIKPLIYTIENPFSISIKEVSNEKEFAKSL